MKNLEPKVISKVGAVLMTIFAMNLIGCGGGGGGSKASTKACPSNPYYDSYEDEWYNSRHDLTSCNPLPQTSSGRCRKGETAVRSPISFNLEFEIKVSAGLNVGPNYHRNPGQYEEVCVFDNNGRRDGREWAYIDHNSNYDYIDFDRIQRTRQRPPVVHQTQTVYRTSGIIAEQRPVTTTDVLVGVGILGVLAVLLL